MTPDSDTLIYFGDACKALGSGRVAGYLVRFGTPESADVQGEYFHAATDFGRAIKAGADVLYHHGMPRRGDPLCAALGNRVIGEVAVAPRVDGLWAEGTLDTSDESVKALYAEVEAGRIGWSSGSANHTVVRTAVKGAVRIDRWPIVEATLSPTPVDKRNRARAIKSLCDEGGAVPAPSLVERSDRTVADLEELLGLYDAAITSRESEGRHLSAPKLAALKALRDRLDGLVAAAGRHAKADPAALLRLRAQLLRESL